MWSQSRDMLVCHNMAVVAVTAVAKLLEQSRGSGNRFELAHSRSSLIRHKRTHYPYDSEWLRSFLTASMDTFFNFGSVALTP